MEFLLLGPLEIRDGNYDLTPSAPKLRKVLALLLLRCNHMVQNGEFIDELWGERPPPSALSTLQTYIYKLRQILTESDHSMVDELLQTKLRGYTIMIPEDNLDLCRFKRLTEQGRKALAGGDPERAATTLSQALSLWRGPALADVEIGEVLSAHATRLDEDRIHALELRLEADLRLGRHHDLISELKALTSAHPLHEGYHAKLMLALHRSGRRSEALAVYQQLRHVLIEQLGLEPVSELNLLQRALLSSDPSLDLKPGATVTPQASGPDALRPLKTPPVKPTEDRYSATRAWSGGRSLDARSQPRQRNSHVNVPVEQPARFTVASEDIQMGTDSVQLSASSRKEMTRLCRETTDLVKEAIVTVTSVVVKPLDWETDCTSTLRYLNRVLHLVEAVRDGLRQEDPEEEEEAS